MDSVADRVAQPDQVPGRPALAVPGQQHLRVGVGPDDQPPNRRDVSGEDERVHDVGHRQDVVQAQRLARVRGQAGALLQQPQREVRVTLVHRERQRGVAVRVLDVEYVVDAGMREQRVGESAHGSPPHVRLRQRVQRLATGGVVGVRGETHALAQQALDRGDVAHLDHHVQGREAERVGHLEEFGDVLGGKLLNAAEPGHRCGEHTGPPESRVEEGYARLAVRDDDLPDEIARHQRVHRGNVAVDHREVQRGSPSPTGRGFRLPRRIREVRLQRRARDGAVQVLHEVRAAPRGGALERGSVHEPLRPDLLHVLPKPVGVRRVPAKLHDEFLLEHPALV